VRRAFVTPPAVAMSLRGLEQGASGANMRAVMQGLTDFKDRGNVLMCMHELNHELLRGGDHVRISIVLPLVTRVMLSCQENQDISILAVRALNTIIDLEPRVTGSISPEVLEFLCHKLTDLTDMDMAEQCIKWSAPRVSEQLSVSSGLTRVFCL